MRAERHERRIDDVPRTRRPEDHPRASRQLVVNGPYRYVRNPMYVAVVAVIAGQGFLFGNISLLEYGAAVWLAFHLFVMLYEEPTLKRSFGAEYDAFCVKVPRWIPRLRPWQPS